MPSDDSFYIGADSSRVINGIEFTGREFDVLACLLNEQRVNRQIAFILSISEKNVQFHIGNILGKIGRPSRDRIIDWIEQSADYQILVDFYEQKLLPEFKFKRSLDRISPSFREKAKKESCLIVYSEKQYATFFKRLKTYLSLLGIKTFSVDVDKDKYRNVKHVLGELPYIPDICICVVPWDNTSTQQQRSSIEMSDVLKQKKPLFANATFLVLEDTKRINIIERERINFTQYLNHYLGFFDLVKKIWADGDIESFIQKFQQNDEIIKKNEKFKSRDRDNADKYVPEEQSIRSDLFIPVESVFLDRSHLIAQIEEKLKKQIGIQTVVLTGIGGAGKTTIAHQFGRFHNSSIIWKINAETENSLSNSFKELAYVIAKTSDQRNELEFIDKIQNIQEKEKQFLLFVKQFLKKKQNWLLIYDNVETISNIKDYLPQDPEVWGKGKVIITTQNGNFKNTSYVKSENIIEMNGLNSEEALTLFNKILYNEKTNLLLDKQRKKTLNFLKHIPPFPLDISHAAYYIKDTQISYEQYLIRIDEHSKNFDKSQETLLKEIGNYSKTRCGVTISSLEKIMNINSSFKELLFFICLLDSQDIPKNILELYADASTIDNFIHCLKRYSLITNQSNSKGRSILSLHRSTQAIGLVFFSEFFNEKDKKRIINVVVNDIISITRSFHKLHLKKDLSTITSLIPHVKTLVNNLKKLKLPDKIKIRYEQNLFFVIGYAYFSCSFDYVLAKKYFIKVLQIPTVDNDFTKEVIAKLLRDLGVICVVLDDVDEAIAYCKDSIKLCKLISNSEILIAENLQIIGSSYRKKNDFLKSSHYYKEALKKIARLDEELKKELESEIYSQLGCLYSITYLCRDEGLEAEKYALKALEILDASRLFCYTQERLSYNVAKHKWRLGTVYNKLGHYKKAIKHGFEEAEYMMNHCLDNYSNDLLLKGHVSEDMGEALLREGDLKASEKRLTESIRILGRLIGDSGVLVSKTLRAETRIRQEKFIEAYEDCLVTLITEKNTTRKYRSCRYRHITYITCFYHAAFIQYQYQNFEKSLEHFKDFFEEVRVFCKMFLEEKIYKNLEIKETFKKVIRDKSQEKQLIEGYLQRSLEIFTAIYGSSHPFVKDYVLKNCNF